MVLCENCSKTMLKTSLLRHIGKAKKCKKFYGPRFTEMKKEKKKQGKIKLRQKYGRESREKELKKMREKYANNSENKKAYYQKNREKLRKNAKDKAVSLRNDSNANMEKYNNSLEFGPEFACICCHGGFFEDQVWVLTSKRETKIGPDLMEKSCDKDEIKTNWYDPKNKDRLYLCKTCFTHLTKKKQIPKRSIKNDLTVEAIEGYTSLENQLIAPCLHFMKIVKLPKSRMEAMKDRTVIVPLEPDDIMKTVEALPRTLDEGAVVQVDFKRMKDMKNTHQSELVCPFKLYKLLAILKDVGNKYYQDVLQKCLYCGKRCEDQTTNIHP